MTPRISVIVCTVDRADDAIACVKGILADPSTDFDVTVVDQSDEAGHRRVKVALDGDARVRFVRPNARGLSRARNSGIAASEGAIIAFTDDDCRVAPGWLRGLRAAFDSDPALGMLFGSVVLRPEDRASGYAAEFEPKARVELQNRFPESDQQWGVGANMAMTRALVRAIGDFDPVLGAGAPLFAAEEIDYVLRALVAGFKVVFSPEPSVVHLGIRKGHEAARLMRRYGIGMGAMFGKHVRLRTPGVTLSFAEWVGHHAGRSVRNALRGDRHPGFGLVASVLWGACLAAKYPLERGRPLYSDSAARKQE